MFIRLLFCLVVFVFLGSQVLLGQEVDAADTSTSGATVYYLVGAGVCFLVLVIYLIVSIVGGYLVYRTLPDELDLTTGEEVHHNRVNNEE